MSAAPETTSRAARERRQDLLVFDIGGMDCASCARTIEAGVRTLAGVANADLNFSAATLRVEPSPSGPTAEQIVKQVERSGYRASVQGASAVADSNRNRRRIAEISIAAVLWLVAFGLDRIDAKPLTANALQLGALALAGYPVARAARQAVRMRRADMNLLMTIAAVGALALGEWEEGSSVLILFAIGLLLQAASLERTRRSVRSLMEETPRVATVLVDDQEVVRAVDQIEPGNVVIVKPGQRVPVDGVVIAGFSSVDQSPITGESVLAAVEPDSRVFAGSINADGALSIRVERAAGDTTIARIIRMIEEAQSSRAPSQAFVDRFAAIYTPAVVGGAVLVALGGAMLTGDPHAWVNRALILLVVACPCALVISTPVALVAAIGAGARQGILFKGGAALEALAAVRAVAFDKTGTLTEGHPVVSGIFPNAGQSESSVLSLTAAIERGSTHPIARGILSAAEARRVAIPAATGHRAIPGRGAAAVIAGRTVYAGNRRLFSAIDSETIRRLEEIDGQGWTWMLVGEEASIEGVIALADPSRPTARAAIARLAAIGVRSVMLSGDNPRVVESIADDLGIDDARGDLLPEQKIEQIRRMQRAAPVAMIGDGINDGPALAIADVGIAMSANGSDLAIETADIALTSNDLRSIPMAINLARATLRTIHQNVAASIGVKALFLTLTLLGLTNLWLAVLADTGMALLVTFNSLRLALPERSGR